MDILRSLQSNPFSWLAISSLTIIGFWLTYKSTQQKIIKYYLESKNIENGLTETRIIFWNSSSNAISESDLPDLRSFCIFCFWREIIDVFVEDGGGFPNKIRVGKYMPRTAWIRFEYLNKGDGGTIRVIHGSSGRIYLIGHMIGVKVRKVHFKKKIEKYTL